MSRLAGGRDAEPVSPAEGRKVDPGSSPCGSGPPAVRGGPPAGRGRHLGRGPRAAGLPCLRQPGPRQEGRWRSGLRVPLRLVLSAPGDSWPADSPERRPAGVGWLRIGAGATWRASARRPCSVTRPPAARALASAVATGQPGSQLRGDRDPPGSSDGRRREAHLPRAPPCRHRDRDHDARACARRRSACSPGRELDSPRIPEPVAACSRLADPQGREASRGGCQFLPAGAAGGAATDDERLPCLRAARRPPSSSAVCAGFLNGRRTRSRSRLQGCRSRRAGSGSRLRRRQTASAGRWRHRRR